jgi:hypothetical protein
MIPPPRSSALSPPSTVLHSYTSDKGLTMLFLLQFAHHMVYQCIRYSLLPTSIEHCILIQGQSKPISYLITASLCVLRVYEVALDELESSSLNTPNLRPPFILCNEFRLAGTITGLYSIQAARLNERVAASTPLSNYVVVSFDKAKVTCFPAVSHTFCFSCRYLCSSLMIFSTSL